MCIFSRYAPRKRIRAHRLPRANTHLAKTPTYPRPEPRLKKQPQKTQTAPIAALVALASRLLDPSRSTTPTPSPPPPPPLPQQHQRHPQHPKALTLTPAGNSFLTPRATAQSAVRLAAASTRSPSTRQSSSSSLPLPPPPLPAAARLHTLSPADRPPTPPRLLVPGIPAGAPAPRSPAPPSPTPTASSSSIVRCRASKTASPYGRFSSSAWSCVRVWVVCVWNGAGRCRHLTRQKTQGVRSERIKSNAKTTQPRSTERSRIAAPLRELTLCNLAVRKMRGFFNRTNSTVQSGRQSQLAGL